MFCPELSLSFCSELLLLLFCSELPELSFPPSSSSPELLFPLSLLLFPPELLLLLSPLLLSAELSSPDLDGVEFEFEYDEDDDDDDDDDDDGVDEEGVGLYGVDE